jgi:hypothetical protein
LCLQGEQAQPTDPATCTGVAIVILLVVLAASYIPARRALRVDPMVALRHEQVPTAGTSVSIASVSLCSCFSAKCEIYTATHLALEPPEEIGGALSENAATDFEALKRMVKWQKGKSKPAGGRRFLASRT